jgi:CHAD domain-containing protein
VARAADIPLRPDMTFAEAAALTVATRVDELWEHSANVLDTSDIERVHDMRVATRRLRAVLEIFATAFPRDLHAEVLREVKALADALGERRDPDVQLEALEGVEGVGAFVEEIRAEQQRGNDVLKAALEHAETTDLRGRLGALVEEVAVA